MPPACATSRHCGWSNGGDVHRRLRSQTTARGGRETEHGQRRDGALGHGRARRGPEVEHLRGAALARGGAAAAHPRRRPPARPAAGRPRCPRRRSARRASRRRCRRRAPDATVLAPALPSSSARQAANSPISFPDTSCITPRPNCAAGPLTARSVSTRTRVPSSAGSSRVVIVAAAVPAPRASRPCARSTARPAVRVGLLDPDGAAVAARDRPELDRHRAGELGSVAALERRSGQAGRDAFDVQEDVPGLRRRRGDGKVVLQLHPAPEGRS